MTSTSNAPSTSNATEVSSRNIPLPPITCVAFPCNFLLDTDHVSSPKRPASNNYLLRLPKRWSHNMAFDDQCWVGKALFASNGSLVRHMRTGGIHHLCLVQIPPQSQTGGLLPMLHLFMDAKEDVGYCHHVPRV